MKKQFLLSTVALVVLGTTASAADFAPRYAKAPVIAGPAYDWTGFYVGLHAGAIDTDGSVNVLADFGNFGRHLTDNFSKLGFLAGGQIGYNYQSGISVFGIEADASWVDAKSSTDIVSDPFFGGKAFQNARFSSNIDWLATVRGRAGIAATPALLLYVTGGLAVAGVNVKYENTGASTGLPGPLVNTLSTRDTKLGWTAGFGAEYALGGNWSVKAEYLRVKLETATLDVPPTSVVLVGGTVKVNQDIDLIRAGINYKFGGPIVGHY